MGIVWEAYHKGVPLLGVPENPIDLILWYLDLQDLGAVKLVRIELPAKVEVHLHFNAHHGQSLVLCVMMGYHQSSFSPEMKYENTKDRSAGQRYNS